VAVNGLLVQSSHSNHVFYCQIVWHKSLFSNVLKNEAFTPRLAIIDRPLFIDFCCQFGLLLSITSGKTQLALYLCKDVFVLDIQSSIQSKYFQINWLM
jgi:hypothetical protein